jgi:hypothetical protein
MKRVYLVVGSIFLWANVALLPAQNAQPKPSPLPPSDYGIGPQLIAWSEMQKPQPVQPQPTPDQPAAQGQEQRGIAPKVDSITIMKLAKPQSTGTKFSSQQPHSDFRDK